MFLFSPIQILIIALVYAILLISSLFFIIKYEKNPTIKILWIIFNFVIPVISSVITIIHFMVILKKKSVKN
jgi:hypothetical protein